MKRAAFSLVELSIVLVILGLLVGGILAGQSLIRAGQLRAVTSEYQRYLTAHQAFRDKYFALPGDMANATSVWGKDATYCNAHAGSAATLGTCNGNGDGVMTGAVGPTTTGEAFQYWKQLSLAGLIEGTYTGISGSNAVETILGINAPTSKFPTGGWNVYYMGNFAGAVWAFVGTYNNAMVFGAQVASSIANGALLRPEEAWNLDTKIDDGKPSYGRIWSGASTSCTTAVDYNDLTGSYRLSSNSVACQLYFPKAF